MKKSYVFTFIFVCIATFTFAQAYRDALPAEEGLNWMSLLIGAVVGLIVGYLLGSRMGKK